MDSASSIVCMCFMIAIINSCTYLDFDSTIREVYDFDPLSFPSFPSGLSNPSVPIPSLYGSHNGRRVENEFVLGSEGCLWSERIDSRTLLCRVFPRLSVLIHNLWRSVCFCVWSE